MQPLGRGTSPGSEGLPGRMEGRVFVAIIAGLGGEAFSFLGRRNLDSMTHIESKGQEGREKPSQCLAQSPQCAQVHTLGIPRFEPQEHQDTGLGAYSFRAQAASGCIQLQIQILPPSPMWPGGLTWGLGEPHFFTHCR